MTKFFIVDLKKSPFLKIWKSPERMRPESWFVLVSLILFFAGVLWFRLLWALSLIGGFIIFIYIVFGLLWVKSKIK